MEIRKTYRNVTPELLYDEMRDFVLKQGATLSEAKLQTYSLPSGASHVTRATLTFKAQEKQGKAEEEGLRVHIVRSAGSETKMMLDVDEKLFSPSKISSLEEDLRFIFGSYESN